MRKSDCRDIIVKIEVDGCAYEARFRSTSRYNLGSAFNVLVNRVSSGYGGVSDLRNSFGEIVGTLKDEEFYVPFWYKVKYYVTLPYYLLRGIFR